MPDPRRPEPTPFSQALGAAIQAKGISLEKLARRLAGLGSPVSIATLSYWRSGSRRPERQNSLDAVAALEEILSLPTGHLSSRLTPVRRHQGPGPVRDIEDVYPEVGGRAREMLAEIDFHDVVELIELATHVTLDIDEWGNGQSVTCRAVFRGLGEGVSRLPFIFWLEDVGTDVPLKFQALHGCEVGRSLLDQQAGIYCMELLLQHPLAIGETAVIEHRVSIPEGSSSDTFYSHSLARRLNELLLWVRFHPDKVPTSGEAYLELDGHEEVVPLLADGRGSLHFQAANIGPGIVGIRWAW